MDSAKYIKQSYLKRCHKASFMTIMNKSLYEGTRDRPEAIRKSRAQGGLQIPPIALKVVLKSNLHFHEFISLLVI